MNSIKRNEKIPFKYPRQSRITLEYFENKVIKRQKKIHHKPKCSNAILSFCNDTSLHGFKHIVDKNEDYLSTIEKWKIFINQFLWTISCILGCVVSVIIIQLIWERYETTPTVTMIETTSFPIWNVPFPAVTICNINKVYGPSVRKLKEKLNENGITFENATGFFANLAQTIQPANMDESFYQIYNYLEKLGYTTESLMLELMQPCHTLLKTCLWLGKRIKCNKLFRVVKSSVGYCCAFNYHAVKIQSTDTIRDTNIQFVSGSGPYVGLDILLDVEADEYISYTKPIYGVEILIHDCDNYPQTTLTTVIAQPGYDVVIAVVPTFLFSSPDIKSLPIKQRECYFTDEVELLTAYEYNYQSCVTDCIVNYITNKCNCLPFYYREAHLNEFYRKHRQCTLHDTKCLHENRHEYLSVRPPYKQNINQTLFGMECYCLPACTEEFYDAKTVYAKRADNLIASAERYGNKSNQLLSVQVHYKDNTCVLYRRDAVMTWDVLYASIGGIFSLCLGSSLISLVEIIYYIWWNLISILCSRSSRSSGGGGGGGNMNVMKRKRIFNQQIN